MNQQNENSIVEKSGRLTSLDVLRGMAIAGMMVVNNHGPGSEVYTQIEHAPWNGFTFADWVFPTFLFVVGVAMPFSFGRRGSDRSQKMVLYGHILQRTVILFLLGIFLNAISYNNFPFFFPSTVRIPGVLQRIAACYFVASLILLNFKIRGQAAWAVGLVAAYWLMLEFIPVPGYGAGVLRPAGSLEWYVDSHLFSGHTYIYAPTPGFDPEGFMSTIPAIATTLFGVLTGQWLRSNKSQTKKAAWMLAAGLLLGLAGAVLGIWMPINKNLWTSSYTVFMAGIDLVCLAILYWSIDMRGVKRWSTPFVIYGMNAISVYFLSDIVAKLLAIIEWGPSGAAISLRTYIYQNLLLPIVSPVNASLVYAISFMLLMYFIAWIMWRRKWFIKI
jgi:predicted acyltransferase